MGLSDDLTAAAGKARDLEGAYAQAVAALGQAQQSLALTQVDLVTAQGQTTQALARVRDLQAEVARLQAIIDAATPPPPPPPPPDPEPEPEPVSRVLIGMSASPATWAARVNDTGRVYARRWFGQAADFNNPATITGRARTSLGEGMYPVLSFKVPTVGGTADWAGVGAGKYDTQLRGIATALAGLPGRVFVALHHEPQGDGTPANFAAMQRRALPLLGGSANVDAGVILNGWWWTGDGRAAKPSDATLREWLPDDVAALCDIVGADTYQDVNSGGTPTEDGGVKARNFAAWAGRRGIRRLGIGEYNALTAAGVKAVGDVVLNDPRFVFACVWNNDLPPMAVVLTGDRLAAFRATLAASRP